MQNVLDEAGYDDDVFYEAGDDDDVHDEAGDDDDVLDGAGDDDDILDGAGDDDDILDKAGPADGRPDYEQPEHAVIWATVGRRKEGAVKVGQVEDEDAQVVGSLRHPVLVERSGCEGVEGRVHPAG